MNPLRLILGLTLTGAALAQVPDGYFVWCSFQSSQRGPTGVFFSHPRNPGPPIEVTGLSDDLRWVANGRQGASCVLRRRGDGALIVGERAPPGHSVDLHILELSGNAVRRDRMLSVGTSAAAGEIPQCALLPDGRILVAATDLSSGPLANHDTAQFNKVGIGIIDPVGGNVVPVPITNGAALPGVFNALVASADGKTCYFGNWVSGQQGDVWALPLPGGGTAIKIAQVGAGVSNLALDDDGTLLIATLNGPPNLYRLDPATRRLAIVPTTTGPLNAIAVESVTGGYAVVTANAGTPVRSVFWMERGGKQHLLSSPNKATISGIDVNPDPEAFGAATSGRGAYRWLLAPNPGGLPSTGNARFGLTVRTTGKPAAGSVALVSTGKRSSPLTVLGAAVHVDLAAVFHAHALPARTDATVPLPIPDNPTLRGLALYVQSFHAESLSALGATRCVELTIL